MFQILINKNYIQRPIKIFLAKIAHNSMNKLINITYFNLGINPNSSLFFFIFSITDLHHHHPLSIESTIACHPIEESSATN